MLREDFYVADTFGLALDNQSAFGMKPVKRKVMVIVSSLINHKHRSQRTNSSGKPQVAALELDHRMCRQPSWLSKSEDKLQRLFSAG